MKENNKPHVVCVSYPAQGHLDPILKLGKLLYTKGFHVTIVNTEFNHRRYLKSRDPNSLDGLPSFRFETIPDGLPPSDMDTTQDIPSVCASIAKNGLAPFRELLIKLNNSSSDGVPPVTSIVSDGVMSFTLEAAKEFGVPQVLFWTTSACGFMAYLHFHHLAEQGIVPLKVYAIGPLNLLASQQILHDNILKSLGSSLWKEDPRCLKWLDSKEPNSVVYVNFGSVAVMTAEQLVEFAWGLANSNKNFLWVIRPDVIKGGAATVPPEFLTETKERGLLASWCPQEAVLNHPAIGGFLTHSGWNSTLESICGGVPVICLPIFAEQPTNCRYSCREWGIGMEIEGEVERGKVETLVRELMDGEKGKEMKKRAMEWKKLAHQASAGPKSESHVNLDNLIEKVLLAPKHQ
ncbi:UDP-glucuronosyl/UDP-glucosyltransferase [Trema orientale]|uniref:Glycosyltransferase n=1 Tax=Trema orientale TaxID=63057 RepID=A0A2P5B209_TREOI|nr:UDP-glucuronosyl/UDP-glucosyltransferase [Trema orientale]